MRLPLLAAFSLVIAAGGRIEPGAGPAAAIVTPAGIAGDSALADELRYLRRHLRPDVEEELARFVGDVAAHRLVGTARGLLQWPLDALARLAESGADYAVNEREALVRRAELAELAGRIDELSRAIDRLEERL